ncbi:sodium:solute symporter family protein [Fluviicola chungangensis]|uniref:Sodium:solute symporter family protein n=1 Tax=Fluviicola chungangensis TaxID=2597671 RepID=A0A556N0W2_9FLAO|nr:sodium:solute symporter family protein [Fluviicola chungangensis]TSJ45668.1 sodium:solute symporter family protein [Fluviicola chungangensis]
MAWIDIVIFIIYFLLMLAVGLYFSGKHSNERDYFAGGGNMSSSHVGLSVVATDVGGGFSIGLGGIGFTMGLSGSWMLFTGLIGAWVSAVVLIPKVFHWQRAHGRHFLTLPQVFGFLYSKKVAFVAAIICIIGYSGFTSSQLLAGSKLSAAVLPSVDSEIMLWVMGFVVVFYTMLGGMKAVIYTDTFQWVILLFGLMGVAIPIAWSTLGGYEGIRPYLSKDMLSLTNITWSQIVNWSVTIIPIWFVGMTLYQRIFACKNEKAAKKAWYIAGILEWPFMAFTGVVLGMLANVAVQKGIIPVAEGTSIDSEMGLPMLIHRILPVGFAGIVIAAYFSAVLSTADSCLMAASGSVVGDLIPKSWKFNNSSVVRISQITTLLIGVIAILLASVMQNVISLMLYAYAFMVSGLCVPIIAALILRRRFPQPALFSMITGGGVTLILILIDRPLPWQLDANIFGLTAAILVYSITHRVMIRKRRLI